MEVQMKVFDYYDDSQQVKFDDQDKNDTSQNTVGISD